MALSGMLGTVISVVVFLIVLYLGIKVVKNLLIALVFALIIAGVLYFFHPFGLI